MAKEYLVVLFPRKRRVKIGSEVIGVTNTKLELEGGDYEVTLGPPDNFTPEKHNIRLRNTAALTPRIIEFEEVG